MKVNLSKDQSAHTQPLSTGLREQGFHTKLHGGLDPQQTTARDMANTAGLQTQARPASFQRELLDKQGTGQLDVAGEHRILTTARGFIVGVSHMNVPCQYSRAMITADSY